MFVSNISLKHTVIIHQIYIKPLIDWFAAVKESLNNLNLHIQKQIYKVTHYIKNMYIKLLNYSFNFN